MDLFRRSLVTLVCVAAVTASYAQQKAAQADAVDDKVRAASFKYFLSMMLGDMDLYLTVTRSPVTTITDGVSSSRAEPAARKLLDAASVKSGLRSLPPDESKRVIETALQNLEEAHVQFIGADTASITFLLKSGSKPEEGDRLGQFLLCRRADGWKVIGEVTDSKAVPPAYLVDTQAPPKPPNPL